ncbi:MAG: FkbM family methyltransferase [Phormidesmis sp. CAN_BIN44]|nr:FkbM family methyltransferase [Phormidesmis sp. CAN_BIN44]
MSSNPTNLNEPVKNSQDSMFKQWKQTLAPIKWELTKQARKFRYRKSLRSNIIELKGIKIHLDAGISQNVAGSIYSGSYEAAELRIVQAQISKNDVVMEIGAGIGLLSCFCAKQIGSDRVFAYEANPSLEPLIRKNYTLNDISPSLTIGLLGAAPGEQTFYVEPDFWSSSTVPGSAASTAITVPVISLNDEIKRINPSMLIVDIEGGEYDLFQIVDLHNIQKIVIEVHEAFIGPEKVAIVMSKLAQAGFRVDQRYSSKQELLLSR